MALFDARCYPQLARFDSFVGDFLSTPQAKDMDEFTIEQEICRIHPFYWAQRYGYIEKAHMEGDEVEIIPFEFNPAQWKLAEECAPYLQPGQWKRVKMVILKSRKMGISTFFAFIDYYMMRFRSHMGVFVIADKSAHTDNIFGMIERFHQRDTLPGKPTKVTMPKKKYGLKLSNESMLELDSGETRHPGTSQTIRVLHMSENAKWAQIIDAETSILNSIPRKGFAWVVKESTAFGVNKFKTDVEAALEKRSSWHFVFLQWPELEDCAIALQPGEKITATMEESELIDLYSLTEENIKFRRDKISDIGEQKFKQDFPLHPREPFQTSTNSYFNVLLVEDRLDDIEFYRVWKECGYDDAIETFPRLRQSVTNHPQGAEGFLRELSNKCRLRREVQLSVIKNFVTYRDAKAKKENAGLVSMWRHPDKRSKYIVSVDPAEGKSSDDYTSDLSAVGVFDCYAREQVAEVAGLYDEEMTARLAVLLARLYDNAILVIEMNNKCGGAVLTYAKERYKYPHLYMTQKITGQQTIKLEEGWRTTAANKREVLASLKIDFKNDDCVLHSKELLTEMLNVVEDKGKIQASPGYTDDRVMMSAIALHIIDNTPGLRQKRSSETLRQMEQAMRRGNPYPDRIRRPEPALAGEPMLPLPASGKRFIHTARY